MFAGTSPSDHGVGLDGAAEATFVRADVGEPEQIRTLINETVAAYEGVDVLGNNTAVQTHEAVKDTPTENRTSEVDVNFRVRWLTVKYALDHFSDDASVVNGSWNHAFQTFPGHFPYNAIEAGIDGMTRAIALELGPSVRVNTVNPGWMIVRETDAPETLARREEIAELHPVGRMGRPGDITDVIAFLASDDAAFVTGSSVLADGGEPLSCRTTSS